MNLIDLSLIFFFLSSHKMCECSALFDTFLLSAFKRSLSRFPIVKDAHYFTGGLLRTRHIYIDDAAFSFAHLSQNAVHPVIYPVCQRDKRGRNRNTADKRMGAFSDKKITLPDHALEHARTQILVENEGVVGGMGHKLLLHALQPQRHWHASLSSGGERPRTRSFRE